MSAPFEKFVVQSIGVNDFHVRVAAPGDIRTTLETGIPAREGEAEYARMMLERYMFIEDAIREKLERAKGEAGT